MIVRTTEEQQGMDQNKQNLELDRLFAMYWMRDHGIERVDREQHTSALNRQFAVWFSDLKAKVQP